MFWVRKSWNNRPVSKYSEVIKKILVLEPYQNVQCVFIITIFYEHNKIYITLGASDFSYKVRFRVKASKYSLKKYFCGYLFKIFWRYRRNPEFLSSEACVTAPRSGDRLNTCHVERSKKYTTYWKGTCHISIFIAHSKSPFKIICNFRFWKTWQSLFSKILYYILFTPLIKKLYQRPFKFL